MKALLKIETLVALPFFCLSWLLCSVYYAILAGHTVASADDEDKRAVLTTIFSGNKK